MRWWIGAAGLLAAWIGLFLPWVRWEGGWASGFAEAKWVWIALAAFTVLALVARHVTEVRPVLSAAAIVPVALVLDDLLEALLLDTPFASYGPGAGTLVSLTGTAVVLVAAVGLTEPVRLAAAIAAGLAVFAWGYDRGPGTIDRSAFSLALAGDVLYTGESDGVHAVLGPDRAPLIAEGAGAGGFAFYEDELYIGRREPDRLVALSEDGKERVIAEPFQADAVVAGHDGVYVLAGDELSRVGAGGLEPVAGEADPVAGAFDEPMDLAGGDGAVLVADSFNGRIVRVEPLVAFSLYAPDAKPGCVRRSEDDPLALDLPACLSVRAVVDADGRLFMALRGAAFIVVMGYDGPRVVAGSGVRGRGEARLGLVGALAVDEDGTLYAAEEDRVRRFEDAADREPPADEPRTEGPACDAIADLTADALHGEPTGPAAQALHEVAPEDVREETEELAAGDETARSFLERGLGFTGDGLPALAEDCGLVGGYDVPVEDALGFCIAYQRFLDQAGVADVTTESPAALAERATAFAPVADAQPEVLAPLADDVLAGFESGEADDAVARDFVSVDAYARATCALEPRT